MGRDGRIKVLWLIKGLSFGGAERLLVSFARAADHKKFEYQAAYVAPSLTSLVGDLQAAGVPTSCLSRGSGIDLAWVLNLRKLLASKPFDVLHTHLPYTGTLGALVARTLPASRRPSVVYTQHSMWEGMGHLSRLGRRLTMRLDDADFAVSRPARDSMPRRQRARTHVIVHGIPLSEVRQGEPYRVDVRNEFGLSEAEIFILAVGNLRPEKGHDHLLKAMRVVVDAGLPVRLAVIGHGPLEKVTRALCAQLGLDKHVLFLGGRNDVFRLLAGADVFVLASLHEGFPVSVMEALAAGVPVVTSAVGGIREAIHDGVEGFIVPPRRSDLLADALMRVVADPNLRATMSVAARRRGQSFDISNAIRDVEQFYLDLVGGDSRDTAP
jgi:glycosyltransferase involved in cell wall biosynthesis